MWFSLSELKRGALPGPDCTFAAATATPVPGWPGSQQGSTATGVPDVCIRRRVLAAGGRSVILPSWQSPVLIHKVYWQCFQTLA